ncbi:MAG: glycosyltransferase family 2 protein, partial [Methylorubrum rhodinum]
MGARRVGPSLPIAETDERDLRVDLTARRLGGAWVTLAWRDVGSGGIPRALVSVVTQEVTAEGAGAATALAEEPTAGDGFAWTGRLPEGTVALRFTALSRHAPFALEGLTLRRRSRLRLIADAARRRPDLTLRAVTWRLLGLK